MKKLLGICLFILLAFPLSVSVLAESVIPDTRLQERLVDNGDLLTAEEEATLLENLNEISERQQFDIAIVTAEGLEGKTAEAYADDWYDYNGYGISENRDGLLLLISMENRDWWVSTCGFGITAVTDAGREYISEKFLPHLSDGNYYDAFMIFADLCDDFVTQAKTGEPYDVGNLPKGKVSSEWILIDLVIGLLLGKVVTKKQASKLKSVRKQRTAGNYVVPGSQMITYHADNFVNRVVTQRTVNRDSSSSGGSRTHTSSSGTTHGGGGGKF